MPDKQRALALIVQGIQDSPQVQSALLYGSYLQRSESRDCDIAAFVPSAAGVVHIEVYRALAELRRGLGELTGHDIDLVPHTLDELFDLRSTLHYPKVNPALCSARAIKGEIVIRPSSLRDQQFDYADLAVFALQDTRTLCRRQLVRTLEGEAGRIYVSKLSHAPVNAVNLHSYRQHEAFRPFPAEFWAGLGVFDEVYRTRSLGVAELMARCRAELTFELGLQLMFWFEHVFGVCTGLLSPADYDRACLLLSEELKFKLSA